MTEKIAHDLSEKERTYDVLVQSNINFNNFLLSEEVLQGLSNCGFQIPSPIQHKAIPLGKCGFDLILKAKSGTGKTAVFSIIALEVVKTNIDSVQALILVPTREIAVQIEDVISKLGKYRNGLKVSSFIGGLPIEDDMKKTNCHIAVGAPGRIKHLIEEKVLKTDQIRLFVLDEADKLMETSFEKTVSDIFNALLHQKQVISSSATYSKSAEESLKQYMNSPVYICPETNSPVLLGLTQYVYITKSHLNTMQQMKLKNAELFEILSKVSFTQCLVFSNYQTRAESISNILSQKGWNSQYISGAQSQKQRLKAFKKLKEFQCRILLSTDLSARGIDASNVDLVINYDIPDDSLTYLHRMGRAGRYGSTGICINLAADGKELLKFQNILAEIGGTDLSVPVLKAENLQENIWDIDTSKLEQIHGIIDDNGIEKTKPEDIRSAVHDLANLKKHENVEEESVASKLENLHVTQEQSASEEDNSAVIMDKTEEQLEINEKGQVCQNSLKDMLENLAAGKHDNNIKTKEEKTYEQSERNEEGQAHQNHLKAILKSLAAGKQVDNIKMKEENEKMHEQSERNEEGQAHQNNLKAILESLAAGKQVDNIKMTEENEALEIENKKLLEESVIGEALVENLGSANDVENKEKEENIRGTNLKGLLETLALGGGTQSVQKTNKDIFTHNMALLNVAKLVSNNLSPGEHITEEITKPLNDYLNLIKKEERFEKKSNVSHDLSKGNVQNNSSSDDTIASENNVQDPNVYLKDIFKIAYDHFIKPDSPHWSVFIPGNEKKDSETCSVKPDKRKTTSKKSKNAKNSKRSKYCEEYKENEYPSNESFETFTRKCDENLEGSSKSEQNIAQYEEGNRWLENPTSLSEPTSTSANHKVPNALHETAVSYFDYYSNVLWNDALTFEDVPSFDNWFLQWQSRVESVRDYVQQNIYLDEMNKYRQMQK